MPFFGFFPGLLFGALLGTALMPRYSYPSYPPYYPPPYPYYPYYR